MSSFSNAFNLYCALRGMVVDTPYKPQAHVTVCYVLLFLEFGECPEQVFH
jgi:hypothetical protein